MENNSYILIQFISFIFLLGLLFIRCFGFAIDSIPKISYSALLVAIIVTCQKIMALNNKHKNYYLFKGIIVILYFILSILTLVIFVDIITINLFTSDLITIVALIIGITNDFVIFIINKLVFKDI